MGDESPAPQEAAGNGYAIAGVLAGFAMWPPLWCIAGLLLQRPSTLKYSGGSTPSSSIELFLVFVTANALSAGAGQCW